MNVAYKAFSYEGERGTWSVFPGLCKGCGLCKEKCPKSCIEWSNDLGIYGTPTVQADMSLCTACGICRTACPDCAIAVTKKK